MSTHDAARARTEAAQAEAALRAGERIGDWIQTYTGRQFWPLDPRPDEVCIEDIAHALSNQCRYSGHCETFYSVADHSVRVAMIVPAEYALWGLMHDAAEAYLVDLPRPLKRYSEMGRLYKGIEAQLMDVICERFGLDTVEPECVKWADNVLLCTEMRDLMKIPPKAWVETETPLPDVIRPLMPMQAKHVFLDLFAELTA